MTSGVAGMEGMLGISGEVSLMVLDVPWGKGVTHSGHGVAPAELVTSPAFGNKGITREGDVELQGLR